MRHHLITDCVHVFLFKAEIKIGSSCKPLDCLAQTLECTHS